MNSSANLSKKERQIVIDWLIEHFPNAFFKERNEIKPLKIGIFDDILDFYERLDYPPFSKKNLREAINYYSSSPAYLHAQKADTARVDIYGIEVDIVTEKQEKYARQRYEERYVQKSTSAGSNTPSS